MVLSVKHISKKYSVHKTDQASAGSFFALDDVSFDLEKGKVLGIIGGNGAGKSTLLKILSEVIPPTSGSVEYEGTMLSILEIGTGFHQDLSGYENVFLNASLLGRKKEQTQKVLDEIIDFSGIRPFIHEPVKSYSSGMYLRLALSIALFIDYDIILLDEVISVGDAEFRLKAIQKIKEKTKEGKACIMISHDLQSIVQLCDECILMEKGKIKYKGKANLAIQEYYDGVYRQVATTPVHQHETCVLNAVQIEKAEYFTSEEVVVKVNIDVKKREDIRVILKLRSYQTPVLTDSFAFRPEFEFNFLDPGSYSCTCTIPANLLNAGSYLVDVQLSNEFKLFIDSSSAAKFAVKLNEWEANKNWNSTGIVFPVRPHCQWEITHR